MRKTLVGNWSEDLDAEEVTNARGTFKISKQRYSGYVKTTSSEQPQNLFLILVLAACVQGLHAKERHKHSQGD